MTESPDRKTSRRAVRIPPSTGWVLLLAVAAVGALVGQVAGGRHDRGFFVPALALVVAGCAAWIDVAEKRIPNALTYPALLAGLALNVVVGPALRAAGLDVAAAWLGGPPPVDALLGFAVCAVFGIVSFVVRGLGGGDVKLIAALGALLGFERVVGALFNGIVVAGLLGLLNWAARGTLIARFQTVALALLSAVLRGEVPDRREVYPFGRSFAPFGLAVFVGLVLSYFVELHRLLLFDTGSGA